jgi:hypothetical protein
MPDADKILQAEQSIQNIASELARMRDAANLLQGAENKAEAVIAAALRVVHATDRFSEECGMIVTRLAAADLNQKLDALQPLHQEVAAVKLELSAKLLATHEEVRQGINKAAAETGRAVQVAAERSHQEFIDMAGLIDERTETLNGAITRLNEQLTTFQSEYVAFTKGAKARSLAILVFVILGFFTSLGWLVSYFLISLA